MKVGDMVTLSAGALKRDTMWSWSPENTYDKKPKPVGIITEVYEDSRVGWVVSPQTVYKVRWVSEDGPLGREGNYGYTSVAKEFAGRWIRSDLKYVSKRKVKKT
tara:strand:+ start:191 stop:502 length:312 start_codon:yes stop_codon:yes gene_type:complete